MTRRRPPSRASSRAHANCCRLATMAIVVAVVRAVRPLSDLLSAAGRARRRRADVRPPTAYGVDNFAKILDYQAILVNTLVVTFAATVMALVFGFVTAWILTRTNVPFKRTLEQLMTVPYYVTPLLGALAWSFLGAPESGFINQLWRQLGGAGALIDITSPMGIAWVMALFEGSVAYVMIGAVMQSMDPVARGGVAGHRRGRWRTMRRVTLPLVAPGVLGAAIFVFAEMLGSFSAALVLGTPARFYVITTAIYQLRLAVSAAHPARRRHGRVAVRGHVRDAVPLPADHVAAQLRDDHRQGVPAARDGRRAAALGAVRRRARSTCCSRRPAGRARSSYASVQKLAVAFPAAANFTLDNFRQALSINAVRTAMSNSLMLGVVTATIGVVITGLLSWIILRSRLPGRGVARIHRDVSAGRAAPGLRVRHDVGVAGVPAADLRHVLGAADRLSDGVPAARRAHDLGRRHAARQEPRRMRAGVRRHPGAIACARSPRRCCGPGCWRPGC